MIKTIRRTEFRKLKAMLRPYYEHLDTNPSSLVTRIYGLHMIKWKSFGIPNKKYLVVMANIFEDLDVGDRFDLKGSTVDRQVLRDEAEYYDKKRNPKIELKDLDFKRFVVSISLEDEGILRKVGDLTF